MIQVLKASAGSGKTYHLALEYIRLLLRSDQPDAYRHILAVTFTNKATEEMKRRILDELRLLAASPEKSRYFKALDMEPAALQEKSRKVLSAILYDYSSFAVSTIDKFFQQALRAFSREIGQFSSYQVQLDREALVAEGVDRVLDSLTEEGNTQLLDWLSDSARDSLAETGRLSLEDGLSKLAKSLSERPEGEDFTRESLRDLRELCTQVQDRYRERVGAAAQAVIQALEGCGMAPEDSKGGFLKAVRKYLPPVQEVVLPSAPFLRRAADPEDWFSKGNSHLRASGEAALAAPLRAFLDCFGLPYKEYRTAVLIRKQLFDLGLASELRSALVAVQKDKNLLSLDDSNVILKGIIGGTDAPFIYEKLGVRFDHFLLDEFQDTADIQWDNFRPLLENAVAGGHSSLVVGDVKQSIYRFRGSDWRLLENRLQEQFPGSPVKALENNWRTCREIVAFNNDFFCTAAQVLDQQLGTTRISALYGDVRQQPRFPDPAPGSVEVVFAEDQLAEILHTLDQVKARGGKWSDVAILVRWNKDGAAIAAELLKNDIPVVSDDSLYVKSSVTVRRLVSQLSLVGGAPSDDAGVAAYLARGMQANIPASYHSLVDLAEGILRDIRDADPALFESEIPYVQSFMDYLQDWVATGGNRLQAFLRDWQEADPKIASPQRGNSVRVITIHKAKGLEFPFVIVPYVNKMRVYSPEARWCTPSLKGSVLENRAEGSYRIALTKETAGSFFEDQFLEEGRMQAVDNLNILYVAFTRAQYGLKVITEPLPKSSSGIKTMGQLLGACLGGDDFRRGEPYPLGRLSSPEKGADSLEAGFPSFPADSGSRLKVSPEAADYFGADGSVGADASRRIRGSVLHGILSRVRTEEDLPAAVEAAVAAGELPLGQREDSLTLLRERLQSVRERGWFSPGTEVRSEAAIIGPDGKEYRPDRVVLHPDGRVDVIDYKFGQQEDRYRYQVQRYLSLYRGMGHGKVAGYLWYLEDNFITFVS